jgi:hypothetical protein
MKNPSPCKIRKQKDDLLFFSLSFVLVLLISTYFICRVRWGRQLLSPSLHAIVFFSFCVRGVSERERGLAFISYNFQKQLPKALHRQESHTFRDHLG